MIEIREYKEEDHDVILSQYKNMPNFFTRRAIRLIQKDLEKVENYIEPSYCLVAEIDQQIVGNLIFKRDPTGDAVYEFQWLATDTTIKKRPLVFKKLMLAGEEYLKDFARIFMLYTSNTENEKNTQSMFLKLNYEKQGILKDFWDDGDDKVIFIKRNPDYQKKEQTQEREMEKIQKDIQQAVKEGEVEKLKDCLVDAQILYYTQNMNPFLIPLGSQIEGYDTILKAIGTNVQKDPIKIYQSGSSPFTLTQCYPTDTSDLYWIQKQTFDEKDNDSFLCELLFTQNLDAMF